MFSLRRKYLNILELKEGANDKEIKKAYRKKALLFHPDRNSSLSAQKEFILINEAYEYLINPNFQKINSTKTKSIRKVRYKERVDFLFFIITISYCDSTL